MYQKVRKQTSLYEIDVPKSQMDCVACHAHLCNVLQPPPERDEDEEHGRRVEEGDGRGVLRHDHGGDDHADGVGVGDGGGQDDQDVHVGGAVADGGQRSAVEVATANELKRKEEEDARW